MSCNKWQEGNRAWWSVKNYWCWRGDDLSLKDDQKWSWHSGWYEKYEGQCSNSKRWDNSATGRRTFKTVTKCKEQLNRDAGALAIQFSNSESLRPRMAVPAPLHSNRYNFVPKNVEASWPSMHSMVTPGESTYLYDMSGDSWTLRTVRYFCGRGSLYIYCMLL